MNSISKGSLLCLLICLVSWIPVQATDVPHDNGQFTLDMERMDRNDITQREQQQAMLSAYGIPIFTTEETARYQTYQAYLSQEAVREQEALFLAPLPPEANELAGLVFQQWTAPVQATNVPEQYFDLQVMMYIFYGIICSLALVVLLAATYRL